MLSLPNMPGMTAATNSGAERGFNVAREEQVRGERLFFFLLFSLFDHALARGLTRRLRILTSISSLSLFLSLRNQTGAASRDETLANASVRERVRDFNRRRDVFETVGARYRGTGVCGGG